MQRVAIVGGGIIGLSLAYALRQRGVPEVTIIDQAAAPNGASIVNAGWITPAHSEPVASPGLVGQSIRWMLHQDSPLYIRPNLRDRDLAQWLFQFWRACNPTNYAHAIASIGELNRQTMQGFDEMAANGVSFQMAAAGLLCAFINPRNLEEELHHLETFKAFGIEIPEALWGTAARDLEPGLSDAVNGAFLVSSERHIRPNSLTDGLMTWLAANNVAMLWNRTVQGVAVEGERASGVVTDQGTVAADAVVIAAGARSGYLTRPLGVRIPLQAGKGYMVDYENPPTEISHPISLYEASMAVTPMWQWTRLAGTMELSGINTTVRRARVDALGRGASRFLRNWPAEIGAGRVSSGLRPMTPDGMPIIDLLPGYRNVALSTGHQMLGLTLAPASGSTLADFLISGAKAEVLEPFAISRFR